eukprot:6176451-Pleurochrysis_carterae.AAC.1
MQRALPRSAPSEVSTRTYLPCRSCFWFGRDCEEPLGSGPSAMTSPEGLFTASAPIPLVRVD